MIVEKVAGDDQTIVQHGRLSEGLVARVVNPVGIGLQGVTVSWTAAPGSSGFAEYSAETDDFASAYFNSWFHVSGDQQVMATVDGYRPAIFVVHVLASDSDIDGVYDLAYSGIHIYPDEDPPVGHETAGAVFISIWDGELTGPFSGQTRWIVSGSFSSSDGSLDVTMRMSPDIWHRYTGTLSLDGDAPGGSGTWVELWRGQELPDTGGTWEATRR